MERPNKTKKYSIIYWIKSKSYILQQEYNHSIKSFETMAGVKEFKNAMDRGDFDHIPVFANLTDTRIISLDEV